ncbi:MAG: hypothetical protein RLO48_17935 [Bauldia litoralis]
MTTFVGSDTSDDKYLGNETVMYGLGGNDILDADEGSLAFSLYGGEGNDIVRGYNENDYIFGGAGDDILCGFYGKDWLVGGPGDDQFWFESVQGGPSKIADFDLGEDIIGFDKFAFKKLGGDGTLKKAKFYLGDKAHDRSDRVVYDPDSGKLMYDKNGNKSGGKKLIAKIGKELDLSHKDFIVGDPQEFFDELYI